MTDSATPPPGLPPVQTLPDCMMPDGADPCKAYSELRAAYEKAIREGRELREQVARSEAENGHYHDRAIKAEARERAAREDAERWQQLMKMDRHKVIAILQRKEMAARYRPATPWTPAEEVDALRAGEKA